MNILPSEDVKVYTACDDDVISGPGIGELKSLNQAIHEAAEELTTH